MIWWLALLELFIFQRELKEAIKGKIRLTDPPEPSLVALHEHGFCGVYRVLFGTGPTSPDAVAEIAAKTFPWNQQVFKTFREVQYRFLIVKNQIFHLFYGAILLFGALVSYPFTSTPLWRSLAISTILAFTGSVCFCFWKLEQDAHLSKLLGTKPNEVEWNWSNISVFASTALMAGLALVSQMVPGSWSWLGQVMGPLMHLGR